MNLGRAFGNVWTGMVDAVLPPLCLACEAPLATGEPVSVCAECYGKLPFWNRDRVLGPQLGRVVADFAAPLLYEGVARELVLGMKFADRPQHAAWLAKLMAPHVPDDAQLLVPVPMHARRLRERTFNQAALLAQEVGRLRGVAVDVLALRRLIASDGQVQRTRSERLRLSSKHFAAGGAVVGRDVVLVDDIWTTGSTAKACALALRRGGARRVRVVTACLTVGERMATV